MQHPSQAKATTPLELLPLVRDIRVERMLAALGPDAELHVVGGAVRDVLCGRAGSDLDLASKLLPAEITARLERASIRVIPTGLKHQTVTALPIPGGESVEITTFRGAGMSPRPGVVASLSIEEDLRYRDFTINAMAVSLADGSLVDPYDGQADIASRVVRAVGEPSQRFGEDPLRILRLVRIAVEIGFEIDGATMHAAASAVGALSGVSIERVREEIRKLLQSPDPVRGMRLLDALGAIPMFLPEVQIFKGFEQNQFHKADLWEHTLEVLGGTTADLRLRLAALLHDVGKPPTLSEDERGRHFYQHEHVGADMAKAMLKRLKFSNEIVDDVTLLVRTHMRPLDAGHSGIRRLLRETGELFPQWRVLKQADAYACKVEQEVLEPQFESFDQAVRDIEAAAEMEKLRRLAVNGHELMAIGAPAGPALGVLIRFLEDLVLDTPELNTREQLLRLAKDRLLETARASEPDPNA